MGDTGTAIGEYESAILRGDDTTTQGQCFIRWEVPGSGHSVKHSDRPTAIRAYIRLHEALVRGHYGLAIYDDQETVVAGWAFEPLSLDAGTHTLDLSLPSLPLRPGAYRLSFALFNGGNNLTGGRLIEKWMGVPPLSIDAAPVAHPQDEWAGVLNLAATLDIAGRTAAVDEQPLAGQPR
jgi:hypothetical protein